MDTATHKAFIDRHDAVVRASKQDIVTAALRAIAPRRLLSDPVHARELFMDVVMSRARALFVEVGKIGTEFADAKNARH